MNERRAQLLAEWANVVVNVAQAGALTKGEPLPILRVETINGPRAGALEINAGFGAGKLLRVLSADNFALARQFVPWPFSGAPGVFMTERFVRMEAGWPDALARKEIRLADLGAYPHDGGRWTAGQNEIGQTVVMALNDLTPHILLAGTTGSGKTVAMQAAVLQLSQDPANQLVLVDGKEGSGLGPVSRLQGVIGPLATDMPTAREALGWVCTEMTRRYRAGAPLDIHRLIVVVDEFQKLVQDRAIAAMLGRIADQGRGARVHALMATHHPTVSAFGSDGRTTKRNLPGRVALLVTDAEASRVVVGGRMPRADHLLGLGDAYCIAPGKVHRTQLVLVDEHDFRKAPGAAAPLIEEWPEFHAEDLGQEVQVQWAYNGAELAEALLNAQQGQGRPRMEQALEQAGLGCPGASRSRRLLKLGRDQWAALQERGKTLVEDESLEMASLEWEEENSLVAVAYPTLIDMYQSGKGVWAEQ